MIFPIEGYHFNPLVVLDAQFDATSSFRLGCLSQPLQRLGASARLGLATEDFQSLGASQVSGWEQVQHPPWFQGCADGTHF
jgi:hypothetical protein